MRCEEKYFEIYGRDPEAVAFCPYRISPLGAHIDHQNGKINGLAIEKCQFFMFFALTRDLAILTTIRCSKMSSVHRRFSRCFYRHP